MIILFILFESVIIITKFVNYFVVNTIILLKANSTKSPYKT